MLSKALTGSFKASQLDDLGSLYRGKFGLARYKFRVPKWPFNFFRLPPVLFSEGCDMLGNRTQDSSASSCWDSGWPVTARQPSNYASRNNKCSSLPNAAHNFALRLGYWPWLSIYYSTRWCSLHKFLTSLQLGLNLN